jgi:hypothetical protein
MYRQTNPPTTAPRMPITMFVMQPWLSLVPASLAVIQPAMAPKMTQVTRPTSILSVLRCGNRDEDLPMDAYECGVALD